MFAVIYSANSAALTECQRREREAERMERDKDRDRAAEMERLDREKVAEMERFEREKAAEMEKMKLEMEHDLKLRQLEMSRACSDDGQEVIEGKAGEDGERPVRVRALRWEKTLAGRIKRVRRYIAACFAEDADGRGSNPSVF